MILIHHSIMLICSLVTPAAILTYKWWNRAWDQFSVTAKGVLSQGWVQTLEIVASIWKNAVCPWILECVLHCDPGFLDLTPSPHFKEKFHKCLLLKSFPTGVPTWTPVFLSQGCSQSIHIWICCHDDWDWPPPIILSPLTQTDEHSGHLKAFSSGTLEFISSDKNLFFPAPVQTDFKKLWGQPSVLK